MKQLLIGECRADNIYQLIDPTQFNEIQFEAEVVKALSCLMPDYLCGVFAGAFILEGERREPDLALIHKSLSHWFVVEVELAGHSLEHHVLPQVRCFRYGDPHDSCISSLVNTFSVLSRSKAASVLKYIPRFVAVVSNLPNSLWTAQLSAVDVQHLVVSIYRDGRGNIAHELQGRLVVRTESLGFAIFSTTDNCLRIARTCGLPLGNIQIIDQFGNCSNWTSREENNVLWIQKDSGPALLQHNSYVQIIKSFDGRISLRPSSS